MTDALAHAKVATLTSRRRPLALASLCTVLFLTFLDNTVVSVALASIQSRTCTAESPRCSGWSGHTP